MTQTPILRIAVTGHRPNRLALSPNALSDRIDAVLAAVDGDDAARVVSTVAISALAEGSDRVFASAALARGWRLEALLPFEAAAYATTFDDSTETPEFHRLLSAAASRIALPGDPEAAPEAFHAAGLGSLDASDALLAVWDGAPSAGRGGTADILAESLRRGRPTLWIDASGAEPLRALRPDRAGASGARLTIEGVAARVEAISEHAAAAWLWSAARGSGSSTI